MSIVNSKGPDGYDCTCLNSLNSWTCLGRELYPFPGPFNDWEEVISELYPFPGPLKD